MTNILDKKVAFYSFGCKLNQSETQTLEDGFRSRGYRIVSFDSIADYYVIDTCTVTDQADAKCRNIIRKAEKYNPYSRIIVTGCMAQMEADKIKKINPNSLVIGTFEKMNLFEILKDVESSNDWENAVFINQNKSFNSSKTAEESSRTRAFLKIQDGCNYICSFCIIPYARGRDRSNSFQKVVSEAKELIQSGFKEIILTGVNIGEYKDEDFRIENVVDALSNITGLERLRISSIEPNTVTDKLLHLIAERPNIMPHIHIPIQSGSEEILHKMRRHYNRYEIEKIIERIINIIPNTALGSDFIVGFPGESDTHFQETVSLIETYPFSYFHTFTYSSRQKTIAERMDGHIESHLKHERSNYLRKLNEFKKNQFAKLNLGKSHKVLVEGNSDCKIKNGFTENYIKVFLDHSHIKENEILDIYLERCDLQKVYGTILQ